MTLGLLHTILCIEGTDRLRSAILALSCLIRASILFLVFSSTYLLFSDSLSVIRRRIYLVCKWIIFIEQIGNNFICKYIFFRCRGRPWPTASFRLSLSISFANPTFLHTIMIYQTVVVSYCSVLDGIISSKWYTTSYSWV